MGNEIGRRHEAGAEESDRPGEEAERQEGSRYDFGGAHPKGSSRRHYEGGSTRTNSEGP